MRERPTTVDYGLVDQGSLDDGPPIADHNQQWSAMVHHGQLWSDKVRGGREGGRVPRTQPSSRPGRARPGQPKAWPGQPWPGQAWPGQAWPEWQGPDTPNLDRAGPGRPGQATSGRAGLAWPSQARPWPGQTWPAWHGMAKAKPASLARPGLARKTLDSWAGWARQARQGQASQRFCAPWPGPAWAPVLATPGQAQPGQKNTTG